jgi:endonuclease YncB( thermonuclease family)
MGEDLGRAMVQLGMAWAFVRYSRDYVDQEAQARAENLGVHASGPTNDRPSAKAPLVRDAAGRVDRRRLADDGS